MRSLVGKVFGKAAISSASQAMPRLEESLFQRKAIFQDVISQPLEIKLALIILHAE
jgi:hypothetical protein